MNQRVDEQVDLLLEQLGPLTEDDMLVLVEAWEREDEAARRRAWTRAKTEISQRGLDRSLEHARHTVARWAAAGRSDYHGIGGLLGLPNDGARLRMLAGPAVLDAVVGMLAGDGLDDLERDTLTRPWRALHESAEADG
ncbi:MAG TPA: hypothetical protein VM305_03300 [Candidatus Limnocylindrales bacterium]|nr:hypothetical protein [Candidatus Limnocylindrales bacterium]